MEELAKSSHVYHVYKNHTSKENQPFTIDGVLDIRLLYASKLKDIENGINDFEHDTEELKKEIAGCDYLLKKLEEGTAY